MAIRWKVVKKDRGSLMVGGSYCLSYKKGKVIVAPKGTLGIMTFKLKRQAEGFWYQSNGELILRVQTKGRGKVPKRISAYQNQLMLDRFYAKGDIGDFNINIPKGTICYPRVKVLD